MKEMTRLSLDVLPVLPEFMVSVADLKCFSMGHCALFVAKGPIQLFHHNTATTCFKNKHNGDET